MSNKIQLQTNNAALDALITRVNAAKDAAASLPEAGGGSSGSVETCTIEVIGNSTNGSAVQAVVCSIVQNGILATQVFTPSSTDYGNSIVINDVVCNTVASINFEWMNYEDDLWRFNSSSTAEFLISDMHGTMLAIRTPIVANESTTILLAPTS